MVRALKRILTLYGFEVDYTLKPEDAIAMISKNRYDLVLCDQKMPGMKGVEILEYSYKVSPETVRILITGYREYEVIQEAVNKSKIHYCLSKPWDNDELLRVITTAINEKREREIDCKLIRDLKQYLYGMLNGFTEPVDNEEGTNRDIYKVENETESTNNTNIIPVKNSDSIVLLNPSDIYYLATAKGKVIIVIRDNKYHNWESLKVWEDKLKKFGFYRCHRSYLVNISKISMITPWFKNTYNIRFKDIPDEIYLSKSYMKFFKTFIKG